MSNGSDSPRRPPSNPSQHAYVTAGQPVVPMVRLPAPEPPATLEDVLREVRATRKLLDAHLDDARAERKLRDHRHEAIMQILQDVLVRLP